MSRAFYEVDKETRNKNSTNKVIRTFSERFEKLLHKNNFHQIEFSEKSKLSSGAISKYCNGTSTPGFLELRDIAKTLNISADYLLGLSDVPSLNKDIQSIAKNTGLSEPSIRYLQEISNSKTANIEIDQNIPKKTRRMLHELFNNKETDNTYNLYALNFILENNKEYNFLELIGKYLFSTTIPYRSVIDVIEEASDLEIPKEDSPETKNNIVLENFKKLIQEITYINISSLDDKQTIGRLSQTEIHNAILVSLNNALSEAHKKIKQANKEDIEKRIEKIAMNYRNMYNDPYFYTAVSIEEDIITLLQNSNISFEHITELKDILSNAINND